VVHLFPPSLDGHMASDDPVRAIDARPGSVHPTHDPTILQKSCIQGHRNRIRSSCQLEAANRLNTEVMWLCRKAQAGLQDDGRFPEEQ